MKWIMRFFLTTIMLFVAVTVFAQTKAMEVRYYFPKDSLLFEQVTQTSYGYQKEAYGQTTLIIQCNSEYGVFDFIFKKKVITLTDYGGDSSEVYGKNGEVVRKDYNEPYTISEHNLYAFIVQHDKTGGTTLKAKFQDFGNEVYWPEFDYEFCLISDEDRDGKPEFYLSYTGMSDGLDAKPFKQIIYTIVDGTARLDSVKSKATAYYPAGNDGDVYTVEYDENWKALPKAIRGKSKKILFKHKSRNT